MNQKVSLDVDQDVQSASWTKKTEVSTVPGRAVMCEMHDWHFIRDLVDALKDPVASAQSWVHSGYTLAVSTGLAAAALGFSDDPNNLVLACFIVAAVAAAAVARFFQWVEKNIPSAKKDRVETIVDYMNRYEKQQYPDKDQSAEPSP